MLFLSLRGTRFHFLLNVAVVGLCGYTFVFVTILKDLQASGARGSSFSPARPAITNPSAALERGYGANSNPIDDPLSAQVAALFDSAYSLMLRMLAWSFEFDAAGVEPQLKAFCSVAIDLMPRVILPLGEGLMLMPAGKKYPGKTAGPGFGLTRHVMLPADAQNARRSRSGPPTESATESGKDWMRASQGNRGYTRRPCEILSKVSRPRI
jgi:hypothetical protein